VKPARPGEKARPGEPSRELVDGSLVKGVENSALDEKPPASRSEKSEALCVGAVNEARLGEHSKELVDGSFIKAAEENSASDEKTPAGRRATSSDQPPLAAGRFAMSTLMPAGSSRLLQLLLDVRAQCFQLRSEGGFGKYEEEVPERGGKTSMETPERRGKESMDVPDRGGNEERAGPCGAA